MWTYFIQQVIPKSEILRLGVLEQSKEEVIVQVRTTLEVIKCIDLGKINASENIISKYHAHIHHSK